MSKYIQYTQYVAPNCLIDILFDHNGMVVAASYGDAKFPVNFNITQQFVSLQETVSSKRSFSENLMVRKLADWFEEAKNKNNQNDFDKEPA